MHYPPFGVLANVLIQSPKLEEAVAWSGELGKWFQKAAPEGCACWGRALRRLRASRSISLSHDSEGGVAEGVECGAQGMLAHGEAAGVPRRGLVVDVDALRLM